MTSEYFEPELPAAEQSRPAGVVLVAAFFAIVSLVALAFTVFLTLDAIPLSYGSLLLPNGLEEAGPLAFLIYGAVTAAIANGLWKGYRWSRRIAVLFAVIGIALVVPAISSAVVDGRLAAIVREGLQIIVRVAIVFYLSQEPVKEWFARQHNQT